MQVTCDYCGRKFKRMASAVLRRDRPQEHYYCCPECSQAAQRARRKKNDRMQVIDWLNGAEENDEKYLVNRIIETAVKMRGVEFGSLEWERLDAYHSAMLDAARDIFRIHGKWAPGEAGTTFGRGDG